MRKSICLEGYDDTTEGAYFVTICTANRAKILWNLVGADIIPPTIPTVVGSMKREISKQAGKPIWQKSFYDHGVRNQQDYDEIWEYIQNDPLKYTLKKA